jgi:hypothetical protein
MANPQSLLKTWGDPTDGVGMKRARSERTRRAVFVMGTMAVAGVLIWSKLRLATNIPRSAYAVPGQGPVEGAPAGGADGPDARGTGAGAGERGRSGD